jgi:hypothetical protein
MIPTPTQPGRRYGLGAVDWHAGQAIGIPRRHTYSPWRNPAEMLWRHDRREVTHCELFESIDALLAATRAVFDRTNRTPQHTLSIPGAHPA